MKNIYYLILLIFLFVSSCSENDNPLAPYAGSPMLSTITVEQSTFKPKVTWIGGYVSVFGVNKGTSAALDSTLIWLVHMSGNNLRYPITYGTLPSGAEDLTNQFGGVTLDSLGEDEIYTYWVLKEDVWTQISSNPSKKIVVDSSLGNSAIVLGDSIQVNPFSLTKSSQNIDVYVNVENLSQKGQLANLFVIKAYSNKPIVTWELKNPSTDSLISAIGLVEGASYQPLKTIWEMYSVRDSSGNLVFGKDHVIQQPLQIGDSVANTTTFTKFELEGLERGKGYLLWIANKDWNQSTRNQVTPGYAYVTFDVR